jgi:hypothetical protein
MRSLKLIAFLLLTFLWMQKVTAQAYGSYAATDCIGIKQYDNKAAVLMGTGKVWKTYFPALTSAAGSFTVYVTITTDAWGQVAAMQELQCNGTPPDLNVGTNFTAIGGSCANLSNALPVKVCAGYIFSCGESTYSGPFVADGIRGQAGTTNFTITGAGFSDGLINTVLTAGQTSITIPVIYDGRGPAGVYSIDVNSPDVMSACSASVTVIDVSATYTFNCAIATTTGTFIANGTAAQTGTLTLLITSATAATCKNATGTLTITQPTDVGMTYSIDGTTYTNTTGIFNNVASGTYSVTAKAANSCISPSALATINVVIPAPTVTIVQPTCTIASGSSTVTNPLGAGFSYSIDLVDDSNTSGVFDNLSPATYYVTAKNSSNCVSAATSVVIMPPVPTPVIATNQPNCTTPTGTLTITTPTTGVTYSFDNGTTFQASNVLSNVTAGTYQIVIKNNADGCVTIPKDVVMHAQPTVGCSCNNITGILDFTASNQNTSASYTQKYILTDNNGVMLKTSNTPSFKALQSNQYAIYALNYKTSEGITGLTMGQNITQVSGICLDVSAPIFYAVCLPTVACNNTTGTITATVSGQNTNPDYTQQYALTDNTGVIIQSSATPSFTGLASNQYAIYALNYRTTEGVNGLTVGQNIADVNGGCLDVSVPLFYTVCLPVYSCNNNSGTITANISGQNTNAGFTQSYALTNESGLILQLSTTPTFTGLINGKYQMFALNYETSGGVTGLSIGMSISSVIGACFNKSNPLLYQVCIAPEICNNRIDDDGDGLIDCEDVTDCPSCGCDNTTGDIIFTNTGQSTTGYTQEYVLTDSIGKILTTNTAATFTGLSSGRYRVYAINYRTTDGIMGITIGGNISGVTGLCFDKSLPLLFKVCLYVTMNLKVMLEGPYQTATSDMQTILNQRGLLPGQTPIGQFAVATPAGQPYNTAPWNYSGTEGAIMTTYPATVVDWVLVTLRVDETTVTPVFRVTGLLHNDGHISFLSPYFDIANGNYHVVIEHRNHVGVMSPNKVPIINGVLTHDFTVNDSYVLINPPSFGQKRKGSNWVMYAGDGKKDTQTTNYDINFQDSQYWKLQSGIFDQYKLGDFDMDADVNFSDNYLWKFNSGKYSAVPH